MFFFQNQKSTLAPAIMNLKAEFHDGETEKICKLLIKNFNRIFQHQYQRQVKICVYLYLFHGWFPLEFVFICSIFLMHRYLLELIKRRSKVREKNMTCEHTLKFDQ